MKNFTKAFPIAIGTIIAIIFMASYSFAQDPKLLHEKFDIDTFITGQMEAFHVPGLSACIIVGDEVVWNNNYGYMNLEDSIPVNDTTLFNAFSIGKTLTAACVMQQYETGNLDIDNAINNYLPFDVINPQNPDIGITSRMLLCHSSSITDFNFESYGGEGDPTESMAFFCENYFPEGGQYYNAGNYYGQPPGLYFHYSNLGVGLNGFIVEAITGNLFHEYAKEHLFSPLNMHQSAWFLGELNMDNLAIGYDYASGGFTPNIHIGHPCYPGIMLRSTALELSQFNIMMLNEGQYQGNEILQSSTIDTMLIVQNPNWNFVYGNTGLGLFRRIDYGSRTVWGHNGGSSRGYAAHLYFCKDEGTGIVIMTNSNQYVDPIVEYMFDYAYELANPPTTSQIQFAGYVSQGEGIAGWNADGSGPEPAGLGHLVPAPGFTNQYFYGSSQDYITGNPEDACAHFLPGSTGFPEFEQALADNGYTTNQVKMKYGLTSLEDDMEGEDWFFFNNWSYSNYYNVPFTFELDGQPLLAGFFDYANMYINTASGNWQMETGYSPLHNIATNNILVEIANAFLNDLDGKEIKTHYEATNSGQTFSGSGRNGVYYNVINGLLTVGNPTLPFKGLYSDHEGFACWDADGSGPEPYGDGHQNQKYYQASADFDGIDPDPDACLAHFEVGSSGFFNTILQLEYRGYEIGDLKIKQGLSSLGSDTYGEDWGYLNQQHWVNYYNNRLIIELNGEPVLYMMADTNKQKDETGYWLCNTSFTQVYNISDNVSAEAQFIAQSFLKDLGTHYIRPNPSEITLVAGSNFMENGRNGSRWEIYGGSMTGIHAKATFVPEGPVSGTWTAEDSPIYVDGHLTVEDGETHTIEPGVKVAVRGPYVINVGGSVKAEGTAEENIIFTRSNPNLWWDGFAYDGALIADTDSSIFDHCIFEYGYAQGTISKHNSGGVFLIDAYDNLIISNSTFRHNKADIDGGYPPSGGAFAFENSNITIKKCIFYDNTAEYGGAILCYANSAPIISNCLFYGNHANNGGAISFYEHGNGILINNTFAENTATQGGALYFYNLSNPEIINTILWGNEATSSGNQVFSSTLNSAPGFYYCDIEEGQAGFGGNPINGDYLFNIEDDPEFETAPEFPPYLLSTISPCFNQGTPDTSAWYYPDYLPATCLCGNPRTCNGRIEMGSYELLISKTDERTMASDKLQIFPNPFIENLTISFELQNTAFVEIEIFNVLGAKVGIVNNKTLPAGKHQLSWDSANFPEGSPREAGIYFCRVKVGEDVFTQKIVKQ